MSNIIVSTCTTQDLTLILDFYLFDGQDFIMGVHLHQESAHAVIRYNNVHTVRIEKKNCQRWASAFPNTQPPKVMHPADKQSNANGQKAMRMPSITPKNPLLMSPRRNPNTTE